MATPRVENPQPGDAVGRVVNLCTLAENPHTCEWRGRNERDWCAFAMGRSEEWLPVVGLDRFDRIEVEYQVRRERRSGMPRFDDVGHCGDVKHLIEAKVKCTASELMAGVGQLLYYRTVAASIGWNVGRLILISPAWPAFFLETVSLNALGVDVVRLSPDGFTAMRGDGYGRA